MPLALRGPSFNLIVMVEPEAALHAHAKLKAGWEHAWLGFFIHVGSAILMLLLWINVVSRTSPQRFDDLAMRDRLQFHFLRTLYTALPFIGILGWGSGIHLFHGGMKTFVRRTGILEQSGYKFFTSIAWTFAIVFSLFSFPLIPLFLMLFAQWQVREKLFRDAPDTRALGIKLSAILSLTYLLIGLAGAHFLFNLESSYQSWLSSNELVFSLSAALAASLGVGDCVLSLWVWKWRKSGQAAAPPDRIQFSLSSLMAILLLLGLWISGLVLFFRNHR
ncbi:MAG: hypothetical protein HY291_18920 [Planctomycetes bacterium]|nr:hypothetical protein [Planctomycetota bacterium]